jgi:uncharacterized membrane protein
MFGPGGGGGAGPGLGINEGVLFAILGGYCLAFIVILAVAILFLMTLMRTLQLVRERNQAMSPGQVWLNFVPCLNIVWPFLTVLWMAKSLAAEYRDRGMHQQGEDYGKKVGLAGLIANIAAAVIGQIIQTVGQLNRAPEIVFVGIGIALLGSVVYLVCLVLYWIKIAGFRKELQENRGREGDEYEDDRDAPYRDRADDDER